MKNCPVCRSSYSDRISFCFDDGSPLVDASLAMGHGLDAPPAPRLQSDGDTAPPVRTPRRRSLITGGGGITLTPANEQTAHDDPVLDVPPPPPTMVSAPLAQAPQPAVRTPTGESARSNPNSNPSIAPPALITAPPSPSTVSPTPVSQAPTPASSAPTPVNRAVTPEPIPVRAPTPEPPPSARPPVPSAQDIQFDTDDQPGIPVYPLPDRSERNTVEKTSSERPSWVVPAIAAAALLLLIGGGIAVATVAGGVGLASLTGTSTPTPPHEVPVEPVAAIAVEPPVEVPPAAVVPPEVPVEAAVVNVPVEEPPTAVDPVAELNAPPVPTVKTPVAAVQTPVIKPAAGVGTIKLDGTPRGAMISIDGEARGTLPMSFELSAGNHSITVENAGFAPLKKTVTVTAGQTTTQGVELWQEVQVGIAIVAIQGKDGLTLYVDGVASGTLPARVNVPEGSHTFSVKNADGTEFSATRDVKFNGGRVFINL